MAKTGSRAMRVSTNVLQSYRNAIPARLPSVKSLEAPGVPQRKRNLRRNVMKKLMLIVLVMAFTAASSLAFALDRNSIALQQAWAAVTAEQKKLAELEKDAAAKATAEAKAMTVKKANR
jgi:hypothetical protein